jgi:membrane-bound metal-dependent hydrolase YbcI (DUF457 family)
MEKIHWRVLPNLCHLLLQVCLSMEPGYREFQHSLTGLAFLANNLWIQFYFIDKMPSPL